MRLRITFSKTGWLRYTGHLDMQTVWERTARRAGLPLAYTHGFHPGPRIQIASALPLGHAGCHEIVDLWLEHRGDGSPAYAGLLQSAAPPGLTILSAEPVDEAGPALQTQVSEAEYQISLLGTLDEAQLVERIASTMQAASLPRRRRDRDYDLRPLIRELSLVPAVPGRTPPSPAPLPLQGDRALVSASNILMRLAAREGATGRPEEVLAVLGIPLEGAHIERTRLILKTEIE
jgi:radical SAM-linked protein